MEEATDLARSLFLVAYGGEVKYHFPRLIIMDSMLAPLRDRIEGLEHELRVADDKILNRDSDIRLLEGDQSVDAEQVERNAMLEKVTAERDAAKELIADETALMSKHADRADAAEAEVVVLKSRLQKIKQLTEVQPTASTDSES